MQHAVLLAGVPEPFDRSALAHHAVRPELVEGPAAHHRSP